MAVTRLDIQAPIDRFMNVVGYGFMLGFPALPGVSSAANTGVPTAGIKGFAPGALFINYKGSVGTALYTNVGTVSSATWVNIA